MTAKPLDLENAINEIRQIPLWLQYTVAVATIFGAIFGGWGLFTVITTPPNTDGDITHQIATSSISTSDLLSKALSLGTVLDRQDLLIQYVGSLIHGRGTIKEVSKLGDSLLVDITTVVGISPVTLTCAQVSTEENDRRLRLTKGKSVSFSGVYTNRTIFEHGLEIGDCTLIF